MLCIGAAIYKRVRTHRTFRLCTATVTSKHRRRHIRCADNRIRIIRATMHTRTQKFTHTHTTHNGMKKVNVYFFCRTATTTNRLPSELKSKNNLTNTEAVNGIIATQEHHVVSLYHQTAQRVHIKSGLRSRFRHPPNLK